MAAPATNREEARPQPPPAAPEPVPPAPGTHARRWPLIATAVALGVGGLIVWRVFFAGPRVPDNIVTLSGRIEGDDSAIATKTGGRILEVRVREGDSVNVGDVIAVLDDDQVRAREDQARAALVQAEAQAMAARDQIAVLDEQLRQNLLQMDQAKTDAAGRVQQADADVAAAEATLAQQDAADQLALFDKDDYTRLAQTGAASERQAKQAVNAADQQAAAVAAARRHAESVRGALATAKDVIQLRP